MKRLLACAVIVAAACGSRPPAARPSILLVTLDTTRADAMGPEAIGVETPAFNALAGRGRRFRQAYATVPETLPSHAAMMTGLYPAGHGVHENGRSLAAHHPVLAERLRAVGYRTAAFVSSFPLARRFGLARGFEIYDDATPSGRAERTAKDTTDAALARIAEWTGEPVFFWVHYFDPHAPYDPPEPFKSQYASAPYRGEIAAMDHELGRLIAAFERRSTSPIATVLVADHGEGLGDHGELLHGNLVYQSTMHVPLAIAGPGVAPAVVDDPVSIRRVYHTMLDWAGIDATNSLRGPSTEVVLGEAMKPFLEYGWQPQVMGVKGSLKTILAGARAEVYDVLADPAEARDLAAGSQTVPQELRDYPVPSPDDASSARVDALDADARRKLAALGYVSGGVRPVVRRDAPRPVDMAPLFADLDRASTLFVQERYAEVIPLLESIRRRDPGSLDVNLRLGTAHSMLKREADAMAAFARAQAIAPASPDVRLYLALHQARGAAWAQAAPVLEQLVAWSPDRVPALEALADLRERQGRLPESIDLLRRVHALRPPTAAELSKLGVLAMATTQTDLAIASFESARRLQGAAFRHDLELGVVYLAARRLTDARDALDRVPASSPDAPMALFKRAQVSVLLKEPDRAARIDLARRRATPATRELIANEALFRR